MFTAGLIPPNHVSASWLPKEDVDARDVQREDALRAFARA